MEIWSSQISVATEAMAKLGIQAREIASIGITNQRETTIVWNKNTDNPSIMLLSGSVEEQPIWLKK